MTELEAARRAVILVLNRYAPDWRDTYGDPDGYVDGMAKEALRVTHEDLLASRRERYHKRRSEGWHPKKSPVPADFPKVELGQMAMMTIVDTHGRFRCPHCSRFCRLEDFAGAKTSATFKSQGGTGFIDFGPACWRCRGLTHAPYEEPGKE